MELDSRYGQVLSLGMTEVMILSINNANLFLHHGFQLWHPKSQAAIMALMRVTVRWKRIEIGDILEPRLKVICFDDQKKINEPFGSNEHASGNFCIFLFIWI